VRESQAPAVEKRSCPNGALLRVSGKERPVYQRGSGAIWTGSARWADGKEAIRMRDRAATFAHHS